MQAPIRAAAAATFFLLAIVGIAARAAASDLPRGAPAATIPADGAMAAPTGMLVTSLAAAVAARQFPATVDEELACLAGAVYFESHGEPLLGQLAVAHVIINRTRSGRYPGSICGVVTQRSQFSFVHGGVMPLPPDNAAYRTALAIAQIALGDEWRDPSDGALSFHARRVSPGWAMTRVATIGNHIFYR